MSVEVVLFCRRREIPKESQRVAQPFKVGKDGTLEEVCSMYEDYKDELLKLRGKESGVLGANLQRVTVIYL